MAGCTGTVGRVFDDGAAEVQFDGWPGDDDVWTIYSDDLEVVE